MRHALRRPLYGVSSPTVLALRIPNALCHLRTPHTGIPTLTPIPSPRWRPRRASSNRSGSRSLHPSHRRDGPSVLPFWNRPRRHPRPILNRSSRRRRFGPRMSLAPCSAWALRSALEPSHRSRLRAPRSPWILSASAPEASARHLPPTPSSARLLRSDSTPKAPACHLSLTPCPTRIIRQTSARHQSLAPCSMRVLRSPSGPKVPARHLSLAPCSKQDLRSASAPEVPANHLSPGPLSKRVLRSAPDRRCPPSHPPCPAVMLRMPLGHGHAASQLSPAT